VTRQEDLAPIREELGEQGDGTENVVAATAAGEQDPSFL
jgi:hypothetical protein